MVRELLARGANPSALDDHGATALDEAIANGHPAVAQLLRAALAAAA